MKNIDFYDFNKDEDSATINHLPDTCPLCQVGIEPIFIDAYQIYNEFLIHGSPIQVVLKCTQNLCGKIFIAHYGFCNDDLGNELWELEDIYPATTKKKVFEEEINEVSSEFSDIFNQALEAESHNLNHIAGMGYRKALEFLIKDYLINFKNEDRDKIEGKFLGKCISENITDQNVKEVAKRGVWLGNDETHYVRKWGNKDINDLKSLIEVTIYWISSEIKTQNILSEMNS
ncbi:hypothetical protein [Chengkuizengella axinellae]|uniref:DUF4145 domain-containing protein n=1 Tax=Chengkuizengella axinellae TaxID=3064388 RepID=A0ABT9IV67_9BACL|nr:hypothetical protein [Chengkuizengella sp. 2205SS18-9]MDP5273217.1 hypothetical protein [Chengkuizengella sp. 2205SS18-9]